MHTFQVIPFEKPTKQI